MKTINTIRKIILLPLKVAIYPMWLFVAFVFTDFESKDDVENTKEMVFTKYWW
mgnify:FL=1